MTVTVQRPLCWSGRGRDCRTSVHRLVPNSCHVCPSPETWNKKINAGWNITELLIWVEQTVSNWCAGKNWEPSFYLNIFPEMTGCSNNAATCWERSSMFWFAGEGTGLLFLLNWASGSVQLHISSVGTGNRAQNSLSPTLTLFPFIRAVAVKSHYTSSDFMSGRITLYHPHNNIKHWPVLGRVVAAAALFAMMLFASAKMLLQTIISIPLRCHKSRAASNSSHWQTFDGHYSFTKA